MYTVSKTFDHTTPESAERGDTSDSGYIFEAEIMTLRETLNAIEQIPCPEFSSFPTIYSDDPYIIDYQTLTYEKVALHVEGSDRAIHWLNYVLNNQTTNH